ncbi:hypothetical protein EMQ25_01245 [Arsenicitalea aurantiaca]|uniref:Colicin D immunity protein domain-containing protein n=1 Tax=Arsenicitalea aurantiaca TaxID=1783274 RepID=A0A433XKM1_9HYPH|nr:colicin immunity domain-containing protein [Arsenicitalea aurantiaca]RUT34619.1 hypothetical protein EMQ25_01245 [Arsenicitalea aurantiaca]
MTRAAPDREPWASLMADFIDGAMDGVAFERAYLEASRAAVEAGDRVPYAADLMFYEVDAFCADPALRGEGDLDEAGLRQAARELVRRLDEPWPAVPGAPTDQQTFETFREAAQRLGRKGN